MFSSPREQQIRQDQKSPYILPVSDIFSVHRNMHPIVSLCQENKYNQLALSEYMALKAYASDRYFRYHKLEISVRQPVCDIQSLI